MPEAQAEPWLSTRYAQNCASCHSPGRKNLPPKDRRCTLSCQGCHVNPNGGGLRSFYGKWTEERWLRSFYSEKLKQSKSPAPITEQRYAMGTPEIREKAGEKKVAALGYKLVEVDSVADEKLYDHRDNLEKITAANQDEFKFQLAQNDPYRMMDLTKLDMGLDYRYQSASIESDGKKRWMSFPMTADLGARWRPLGRKYHLVWEARGYGIEGNKSPKKEFETMVFDRLSTRSLYAMVDDLPWNIFVMGGYYRVLIGNYVPDHRALEQQMLSMIFQNNLRAERLNFEALSFGTAPNVPYLNLHIIRRQLGASATDATKGFAANLGLRFVTLGGSLNYTYVKTSNKQTDNKTDISIHTIGAAAKYMRLVASLEALAYERDISDTGKVAGGVVTLDTYTQLWRENYLNVQYASVNTSRNLRPGDGTQFKIGIKSFMMQGIELLVLLEDDLNRNYKTESDEAAVSKSRAITSQVHLYL